MKLSITILLISVCFFAVHLAEPSLSGQENATNEAQDKDLENLADALEKKYRQQLRAELDKEFISALELDSDEGLENLRKLLPKEIEKLIAELDSMKQKYGQKHPLVLQHRNRLAHYIEAMKKT